MVANSKVTCMKLSSWLNNNILQKIRSTTTLQLPPVENKQNEKSLGIFRITLAVSTFSLFNCKFLMCRTYIQMSKNLIDAILQAKISRKLKI